MKDRKLEISQLLHKADKNVTWLKEKLRSVIGREVDVYYLLSDKSKNFDVDVYDAIIRVFKKEGFITSENERCEKFAEQLIQVNGIISHSTYLLNSNASIFIKDNVLDFREKRKLMDVIEKMKNEFNDEIEQIEKIIEG